MATGEARMNRPTPEITMPVKAPQCVGKWSSAAPTPNAALTPMAEVEMMTLAAWATDACPATSY